MSATSTAYPKSLPHGIDPLTATLKVMLLEGYTFDATHEFVSDVVADEITGTGYDRVTLTTVTGSYDSGTKTWKFLADDPTWTGATFTTGGAVLYADLGSDATNVLMTYTDFGGDQSPADQDWSLHIPSTGFLKRVVIAGGA